MRVRFVGGNCSTHAARVLLRALLLYRLLTLILQGSRRCEWPHELHARPAVRTFNTEASRETAPPCPQNCT